MGRCCLGVLLLCGWPFAQTPDTAFFEAKIRPVLVAKCYGCHAYQLGVDHTRLAYRYAGRDFRLTDVYGDVVKDLLV